MAKNTALGKTIESLKERLAKDPLSRAFLQLAEEYRKLGRFDEATEVCLQGLQRHPAYLPARIALGRTYLEAGNLDLAHQTLADVHRTMPENHLAGKLLAEVQRRMGRPREAADTYRAMLRHSPGDREVEALLSDLQEPPEPRASRETNAVQEARPTAPPAASAALDPALDYRPGDIDPTAGAGSVTTGTGASARPVPERRATPAPEPSVDDLPTARVRVEPVSTPSGDQEKEAGGHPWPASEASPAPGRGPEADEEPDALQTNTLAELYLRQGLVQRALEVYRAMLRLDPANERLRRRLEELEPGGARPEPDWSKETNPRESGFQWTGASQDESGKSQAWAAPEAGAWPGAGAAPEAGEEPRNGNAPDGEDAFAAGQLAPDPGNPTPAPRRPPKALRLERWLQAIQCGSGAAAREARER